MATFRAKPRHLAPGRFRVAKKYLWDCVLLNEFTASGAAVTRANNWAGGAYNPTFTSSPTWATCEAGACVTVASGSSVDLPDHGNVAAGDFTVRYVHRPTDLSGGGGFCALFDKGNGTGRELSLFCDASGNLSFYGVGKGINTLSIATGMTTGSVWDLWWTRKGSTNTIYVNGVAKGTFTDGSTAAVATALAIGRNPSGGGGNYSGKAVLFELWRGVAFGESLVRRLAANRWWEFGAYRVGQDLAVTGGSPPPPPPAVTYPQLERGVRGMGRGLAVGGFR